MFLCKVIRKNDSRPSLFQFCCDLFFHNKPGSADAIPPSVAKFCYNNHVLLHSELMDVSFLKWSASTIPTVQSLPASSRFFGFLQSFNHIHLEVSLGNDFSVLCCFLWYLFPCFFVFFASLLLRFSAFCFSACPCFFASASLASQA